jgi:hypothetical protein
MCLHCGFNWMVMHRLFNLFSKGSFGLISCMVCSLILALTRPASCGLRIKGQREIMVMFSLIRHKWFRISVQYVFATSLLHRTTWIQCSRSNLLDVFVSRNKCMSCSSCWCRRGTSIFLYFHPTWTVAGIYFCRKTRFRCVFTSGVMLVGDFLLLFCSVFPLPHD